MRHNKIIRILGIGFMFWTCAVAITPVLADTGSGLDVTIETGKNSTVPFIPGTEGTWYVKSNSQPNIVIITVNSSSAFVGGLTPGSSQVMLCTKGDAKCLTMNVTVTRSLAVPSVGAVLGKTTYANGLLVSQGKALFLVYRNQLIPFANYAAFQALGYASQPVAALPSGALTLTVLANKSVTTSKASHPWGSWIQSGGTIYFVHELGLIPVPDWNTFISNGGSASFVVKANSWDLQQPKLSVMVPLDARLK